MLYAAGTYFEVMLRYVNAGATTVAYLCSNNAALNTCGAIDSVTLQGAFASVGLTMALDHFIELDSALTTYGDDLASAVGKIGTMRGSAEI